MDAQRTLGVDRLGGCSDDDAFSDALSRQASLGGSDECLEPAPTPCDDSQQAQQAAEPPREQQLAADQQQQQQSPAPARRGGKPLLQRVMEALKQQGHLQQKPAAEGGGSKGAVGAAGAAGGEAERAQQHQQPQAEQRADGGPSTPRQQQQQPRLLPLPGGREGGGVVPADPAVPVLRDRRCLRLEAQCSSCSSPRCACRPHQLLKPSVCLPPSPAA